MPTPTITPGGSNWSHHSTITPPTGPGSTEWSHYNSDVLTPAQIGALSQGAPVSTGPGLKSTGGPPASGSGTPGQSPQGIILPGGTTTLTGLLSSTVMGIPLWVVLGVIGLVVFIAVMVK
jgi:hypothetical protein